MKQFGEGTLFLRLSGTVPGLAWVGTYNFSTTLLLYRTFSATYPSEATYKDFVYSLEHVQSDASHQLSVLCKFVREKQRLRIGGLLLPDLVQFYVWLHQQLSHLITRRRACDLSVGNVVERLTKRYSATYADNIRRLFSRVQGWISFGGDGVF